jgi:hypothetical protein|nr:MAG TPA: hypothetical protein [Caudoviricetes sp.]
MNKLKEKLSDWLGGFGVALYFVITLAISVLPFVMIDTNFILTIIFIGIEDFLPITTIVFWIWGLVAAIKGVQDVWAIIYYIAFAVLWLPYFINIILALFQPITKKIERRKLYDTI